MANPGVRSFGNNPLRAGGVASPKYNYNGVKVINKTGSAIGADKLVAIVGFDTTADRPKIVLNNADTASHGDLWVTLAAVPDNAEAYVFKGGRSTADLNTNSFSAAGDVVYNSN